MLPFISSPLCSGVVFLSAFLIRVTHCRCEWYEVSTFFSLTVKFFMSKFTSGVSKLRFIYWNNWRNMVTIWMNLCWLYIPENLFSMLKYFLANSLSLRQNIIYADALCILKFGKYALSKLKLIIFNLGCRSFQNDSYPHHYLTLTALLKY